MKNYSLGFSDARFDKSMMVKKEEQKFYTLYEDQKSLYILTPTPNADKKEMMTVVTPMGMVMVPYSREDTKVNKVWYAQVAYRQQIKKLQQHLFWWFLLGILGAVFLSLLSAWYTLRPLRSSLHMLEDFIKDIIHDLNTPLTSIMLSLKMIEVKNEEIEGIRTATQTIEMLHHNLDSYLKETALTREIFSLSDIIEKYIAFFTPLYDYISWDIEICKCMLSTDKQSFERIIYNFLSNACKYNTSSGKIRIYFDGTVLYIRNSSYGVKYPNRVFERFYKESERGLGIGLHIVDKLCTTLQIEKSFILEGTDVIVALECKNILI